MYCAYTQCVHRSPERRRCGRTAASALVTADLRLHVPSISASQVQYLSLDDYLLHSEWSFPFVRAGAMYIPISYCIGLLALAHENRPVRGGLAEKLMAAP